MFRLYYILVFPLTLICLMLLAVYRGILRYAIPKSCHYLPSCSKYAWDSVLEFGAVLGCYFALKRLVRCTPNHHGGYDFVRLNLAGNYKWKC